MEAEDQPAHEWVESTKKDIEDVQLNNLTEQSFKKPSKHVSPASTALQQLSEILGHSKDGNFDFRGNTPTIPINDLRGDEASRYAREERITRCQLAALYRLIDIHGWSQSIYNHISTRCSSDENTFLINPYGLLYHEIQASSLVKIDSVGNIQDPGSTVLGLNKAGWSLHAALHVARPNIGCVLHMHLPDVIAVSCIKSGLLPTSPEAVELLSTAGVQYHEYQDVYVDATETSAIREDLGASAKILFLRNNGVVIAAATIPEAWYLVKRVVAACQAQMRLLQLGGGAALLTELVESAASMKLSGSGDKTSTPLYVTSDEPITTNGATDDTQTGGHTSPVEACNGGPQSDSSNNGESIWAPGELEFEAQMRLLDSAGFRTGHVYRQPNLLRRTPGGIPWSGYDSGNATGADFFTTDLSAAEMSGVDDITAAKAAGAVQVAKINDHVRTSRAKAVQRTQWLSDKSGTDTNRTDKTGVPSVVIDEPHSPLTHKGKSVNRSATLPASTRNEASKIAPRSSNTLENADNVVLSDDEEMRRSGKKKKKFSNFRFPTFKKKKQSGAA